MIVGPIDVLKIPADILGSVEDIAPLKEILLLIRSLKNHNPGCQ